MVDINSFNGTKGYCDFLIAPLKINFIKKSWQIRFIGIFNIGHPSPIAALKCKCFYHKWFYLQIYVVSLIKIEQTKTTIKWEREQITSHVQSP